MIISCSFLEIIELHSAVFKICIASTCDSWDWIFKRSTLANKILSIFKSKNGKYYFQPDQRCEIVAELCKEYPEIAKDVLPLKEYMKIHYPSKLEELIKKCKELCFNHKPKPIDPDELHEDHKSSFYNKLERELA